MATGVCAIAMGTGHPGAGPAGGALRGSPGDRSGPAEGWGWGLGAEGSWGGPGLPGVAVVRRDLRSSATSFLGLLALPAWRGGEWMGASPSPPSRS